MLLTQISNQELISRMEKLVRTQRKITHLVLLHIVEIEDRKLYAKLGFDGMYSYLTKGLGYSESSAYRRLQSARLLRKVPEIAVKIEEGKLNLSQLTQVQKSLREQTPSESQSLTPSATLEVLEKIENKSAFETERVLASEFNRPVQVHESVRPQKDDSVRIELTFTKKQFADLEQAKSLLSHVCHEGNWSEVISQLAKEFNRKKLSPAKVTKVTMGNVEKNNDLTETQTEKLQIKRKHLTQSFATMKSQEAKRPRQYISIEIKRALFKKSNGCCEFTDQKTGKRCDSKYQLQIDHIHPWSLGGTNQIENLRLLCRMHNNFVFRSEKSASNCSFKKPLLNMKSLRR